MTTPRRFDSKAASIRPGLSRGRKAYRVKYVIWSPDEERMVTTSKTFYDDEPHAIEFRDDIRRIGVKRTLEMWNISTETPGVKGTGPTVAALVDEWIRLGSAAKPPHKRKMRNEYLELHIAPMLGSIHANALTQKQIREWMVMMTTEGNGESRRGGKKTTGLSDTTMGHALAVLKSSLKYGISNKLITENPATDIKLPSREGNPYALTVAEFIELRDAFDEHYHLLLEFLVTTGARWGEATGLHPRDVRPNHTARIWQVWVEDGHDNYVRRPGPKTVTGDRIVDVPSGVYDRLDLSDRSREFLFTDINGNPYNAHDFIHNVWDPAVNPLKFPQKPTPKTLRSTYATWQADRDVNPKVVQYQMGHKEITTTMKYYTARNAVKAQEAAAGLNYLFVGDK